MVVRPTVSRTPIFPYLQPPPEHAIPQLIGILLILTPIPVVVLALTMVGAAIRRVRRKEYLLAVVSTMLMALALLVAYGRFVLSPLEKLNASK